MKLLADENVDFAIVDWLRSGGHDVVWAAEGNKADSDADLLHLAEEQSRIMVTGDLGFGEMVYRQRRVSFGVVLMRLRARSQAERLRLFQRHWPVIEQRGPGHFIVVANRKVRVRPLG